jgi:hypothetical protein
MEKMSIQKKYDFIRFIFIYLLYFTFYFLFFFILILILFFIWTWKQKVKPTFFRSRVCGSRVKTIPSGFQINFLLLVPLINQIQVFLNKHSLN